MKLGVTITSHCEKKSAIFSWSARRMRHALVTSAPVSAWLMSGCHGA